MPSVQRANETGNPSISFETRMIYRRISNIIIFMREMVEFRQLPMRPRAYKYMRLFHCSTHMNQIMCAYHLIREKEEEEKKMNVKIKRKSDIIIIKEYFQFFILKHTPHTYIERISFSHVTLESDNNDKKHKAVRSVRDNRQQQTSKNYTRKKVMWKR